MLGHLKRRVATRAYHADSGPNFTAPDQPPCQPLPPATGAAPDSQPLGT
ncbi:hypothetical protein Q5H92_01870 [Hymenobacter sp. M29]|uniref:Transposase n=1 Tax=Hymenobacter mellowenesis TaxID=3063995 RepID=A0ABT9A6P6_9BACT|nr:hypothetical protein [Hymenobacter sp. M29]MDO7845087.1 hypothetical protein [Hymenobacter sp. M29]